jgi:hypothetical protein
MKEIEEFVNYWTASHKPAPNEQNDGNVLYNAYMAALRELESSRAKTAGFLCPENTGKGWHPGFDPDKIEEITALAAEIEAKRSALKSISQAIGDFVEVAGAPSLGPLAGQLHDARQRLSGFSVRARNVTSLATNKNPRLAPAEIQDLPEVLEANAALAKVREDLGPQIADLTGRLEEGRKIVRA